MHAEISKKEDQLNEELKNKLYQVPLLNELSKSNFDTLKEIIVKAVHLKMQHCNLSYFLRRWIEHDPTNQQLVKTLNEYLT